MKFLIATLAITFSVNSFAHGFYLNPSQQTALAPFFGTTATIVTFDASTDATSSKSSYKAILVDANEFRLTGNASAALEQSIKNIQSDLEVSDQEAVDLLESIAVEALDN